MNRRVLALVFSVLACSPVEAYDFKVEIPPGSAFTRAPRTDAGDPTVYFRGQATLQVTFRFVYDKASNIGENSYLLLMPDKEALAQLPYLTERGKPDRPTEITVVNTKEAAKVLLSTQLASELKAGKHKEVSGRARVVIDNFGAGFDCDAPSFVARFVSLGEILVAAAATPAKKRNDC